MDVREKLTELLEEISYDKKLGWYDLWDMRNGAEDIADLLIAHGVTVQEWISVKDRLPDVCGNVLTYSTEYGDIELYYYMGRGEFDHQRNGITDAQTHGFTHWMPLPQPPKGE